MPPRTQLWNVSRNIERTITPMYTVRECTIPDNPVGWYIWSSFPILCSRSCQWYSSTRPSCEPRQVVSGNISHCLPSDMLMKAVLPGRSLAINIPVTIIWHATYLNYSERGMCLGGDLRKSRRWELGGIFTEDDRLCNLSCLRIAQIVCGNVGSSALLSVLILNTNHPPDM